MSRSTQVTFSPEEDVKLAELVSGHPCIFNAQHALYKNQGVRDYVWQKISEDMNKNEILKEKANDLNDSPVAIYLKNK
ncbi:hypothetical protein QTP88_018441 [Uroleucon formosanum]